MKKLFNYLTSKAFILIMLLVTMMTITSCIGVSHHYDEDEFDEDERFWLDDPSLRPSTK